jgi:hypothetical protein
MSYLHKYQEDNLRDGKHVALTKCYFCGGDNELLLHKSFGNIRDKAHGKVISKHPCPKCEGYLKEGHVILISAREPKPSNPPAFAGGEIADDEPYRTGGFWVVKREAATRWFGEGSVPKGVAFISNEMARKIGFPDCDKLVE